MLRLALVAALVVLPRLACAADDDIVGTYRLMSLPNLPHVNNMWVEKS